tara:strand:- start:14961 stop:15842 length:882 start_codon:yes stop_codon:yes gene_type:complete
MKKNILVIGKTGMLGSQVFSYLSQNPEFEVYGTTRDSNDWSENTIYFNADCNFIQEEKISKLITQSTGKDYKDYKYDYVINCIGVIKPYSEKNKAQTIFLNSLFPAMLSKACDKEGIKMLHISTDCVFDGDPHDSCMSSPDNKYDENSPISAQDLYGQSKALGENNSGMTLRTSIIGEELDHKVSLLEWLKSQKGKEVNGFMTHYWQGLTTKQLSKSIEKIINLDLYNQGIHNIHSPFHVTKRELVRLIDAKFNLCLKVKETYPLPCDRTLSSVKYLCGNLNIPKIEDQIKDL